MHGGDILSSSKFSTSFVVLFLVCLVIPLSSASAESEALESIYDGRVIGVTLEPDSHYQKNWSIFEGAWLSMAVECNSCTVIVELDEQTFTSSSDLTLQAQQNGTVHLSISSSQSEYIELSLIESIQEEHQSLRPSPTQEIDSASVLHCTSSHSCMDAGREHLESILVGEYTTQGYLSGIIEQSNAEYVSLDVLKGETLELQLRHSPQQLQTSIYFQNASAESLLNTTLDTPLGLSANEFGDTQYLYLPEDGRVILKIESEVLNAAWVIKTLLHAPQTQSALIQNPSDIVVSGHHATTSTIELSESESMNLLAFVNPVEIRVEQLSSGVWITGDLTDLENDFPHTIYPLPNISAVRIHISAPAHWVKVTIDDFSDIQSGHEAPSLRPSSQDSDNASWPEIPLSTGQLGGQLTLAIFDTADVYRLNITGWEDSRHMIQVTVEGSQIENLTLELLSMEQTNWDEIETTSANFKNGKIQLALEFDPGTHFIRISLMNTTNFTGHQWGENIPSIDYFVSSAYTLTDEGYEPYFPPDENAEKWGVRSRMILGLLFLTPVLLFAVNISRQKKSALIFANKSGQLVWYRQQMDSGEITPKKTRKNLIKALQSITLLDWQKASKAWGAADLEHRTTHISLAVWKLDSRLAEEEGGVPVMVGLNVLEGNWDLAALRFDAPEGQAWIVKKVEPRFLHRGEEVFIDTMAKGNRTFVMVELSGSAQCVDIELNGRVDGQATAARIPKTLWLNVKEEE